MKRILTIMLIIVVFMLTACGTPKIKDSNETIADNEMDSNSKESLNENKEEPVTNKDAKEEKNESEPESIEVDKSLLTVEVTYPPSLVGENKEELLSTKEEGIKKVTKNEDGSITLVMTKSKYNDMMKEAKKQTIEFLDSIVDSGDYQSVKKVTYNDDFTEIVLEVDKKAYENSFDAFVTISIAISSAFYNIFESGNDYKISIKVKDVATGEIFNESIFPDDFEDM